jgi:hypothetical protein
MSYGIKINRATPPFFASPWRAFRIMIPLALLLGFLPEQTRAQEEATSPIYRYRGHEMSTGYYEPYEVSPRPSLPLGGGPIGYAGSITLSPTAEKVRRRTYLANSHQGLRFYERLTCVKCHPGEAGNLHTVRVGITCRQCHGPEPIAGINHYYSPMNNLRRHAYVCAKCHEGANASYATYVVHEPNPATLDTRNSFPTLFYVFWMMVAIAAGTFVVFLPHAAIWGIREFFTKKESLER